jgi:2-polyprenyl-3-methyl-5-hydroxy-6-metoxy-1,4-benzoquinol methylase
MTPMKSADTRNYDAEAQDLSEHRYAYDFDLQMHQYMMRSFRHFFAPGNALELGCFHGHFTRLLDQQFQDVEVVEASRECIDEAARAVGRTVQFHHSTFETFAAPRKYANIFLIHTLEHLDEPVRALTQIGTWLAPGGRLFVATPNAHAASRQIAVAMGLISSTSAVTPAERAHGHRTTYAFDTLAADIKAAGLTVAKKGGIFFKGLANFQLDSALAAGIISQQYFDGCYALGDQYPDMCSSIYFVCESAVP